MKRVIIFIVLLLNCTAFCSCSKDSNNIDVVATTIPVYEFTSFLCEGTNINVTCLVTESVSCLHDYSLQVKQMRAIEQAECIVISGAGLEDFMGDILPEDNIIDSSTGIEPHCTANEHDHSNNHSEHKHDVDPHIWLSPKNGKQMAHNIYLGLVDKYPEFTQIFTDNATALQAKFDSLIKYADDNLSNLTTREIVTFHDGFSYMASAFNISILHAIEEEPGSETSAATLIELTNIITQHKLDAIFVEKNGSTASASIIAAETGADIFILDMALSGNSYFDAMYYNIDVLKEALI